MCRKNQLCGSALAAFGLGLLVGNFMSSGFSCFCISVGLIAGGIWCCCKR